MTVDVTHCPHSTTDIVELKLSKEWVARICTDCLTGVPLNWTCVECCWDVIEEFGGKRYLVSTSVCPEHQFMKESV